jgi:hypothetical protein
MKSLVVVSFALLAIVASVLAGPANGNRDTDKKPVASAAISNAWDAPVPQSRFVMDNGVKDPFFPNSRRLIPKETTNAVVQVVSDKEFPLKGISGIAGQRLVLICNRNFAEGEAGDVKTQLGRTVHIKVTKIKETSALILVDGQNEPFEVFLPKYLQ